MIFSGLEKIGFILWFQSPEEFYAKFPTANELIKLSKIEKYVSIPNKNEISIKAKFLIEYNSDYVLCEVLEDLKYDEVFCLVLLCNSNIKLKVNFQTLIKIEFAHITNDSNCYSLKLNDFCPTFPNNWNDNLMINLKNTLTYEKFIVKFRSAKADPSDGRYPVDLLKIRDRKCFNDEFRDSKWASRSSEYFKLALENEIYQIFNAKTTDGVRYKISTPIVKTKPVLRVKLSPSKTLNVKAQPFTPSTKYTQIKSPKQKKSSEIQFMPLSSKFSPLLTHRERYSNPFSPSRPNSEYLTSNIVSMFSEMYRNRQMNNMHQSSISFENYKNVFPSYGGVNFEKPKTPLSISSPVSLENSNHISTSSTKAVPDITLDLLPLLLSSTIPIASSQNNQVVSSSSVPVSPTVSTPNTGINSQNFPNFYLNGSSSNSFSTSSSGSFFESVSIPYQEKKTNLLIDVHSKSVPFPPTNGLSSNQQQNHETKVPSYIISAPPKMYNITNQEVTNKYKSNQSSVSENLFIPVENQYDFNIVSTESNCNDNITHIQHVIDAPPQIIESHISSELTIHNNNQQSTVYSDLNNSSKEDFILLPSYECKQEKVIKFNPNVKIFIPNSTLSYPTNTNELSWPCMRPQFSFPPPRFPLDQSTGNFIPFSQFRSESIFQFHPNIRQLPNNFYPPSPTLLAPFKIPESDLVVNKSGLDNFLPKDGWIEGPKQLGVPQQIGNMQFQPINVIYYKPI